MIDINKLAITLVEEAMHKGEMSSEEAEYIIEYISA